MPSYTISTQQSALRQFLAVYRVCLGLPTPNCPDQRVQYTPEGHYIPKPLLQPLMLFLPPGSSAFNFVAGGCIHACLCQCGDGKLKTLLGI